MMGMKPCLSALVALVFGAPPTLAQAQSAAAAAITAAALSPGEIVAAAPASEWVRIAPSDLLVMDLAPASRGKPRRVVIQLMPPPFSQGWIGNIRKLAAAHWWDGLSVNRVQDNYVAQWGDADGEDKAKARTLPSGLVTVPESEYVHFARDFSDMALPRLAQPFDVRVLPDPYVGYGFAHFEAGWPTGRNSAGEVWPVHCYGMVGVGRNLPPDTGSGAELYTVIGHAPRHLDRNIALVGRVIEGIEHLSSLPRGTGALGFYETPEERTKILSLRLGP